MIRILALLIVLLIGSRAQAVLPPNPPQEDAYATSAPSSPVSISEVPLSATALPSSSTSVPSSAPGGTNEITLSDVQREELLKKARNLNTNELQAIAKSFQQQMETSPSTESSVKTSSPLEISSPSGTSSVKRRSERGRSIQDLKREQAFNHLLEDALPLSPDQITRMHKFYDITLQAKATPPNAPPSPQFTSTVVNLEPGSSPPVIRLAAGFVTSVLFIDSTGAPWPITAYSIGDPQIFNIQWNQKDNTLFIQSLKPYSHGNMAVRLWGLDTPVVLTLVSGQRTVDFRVDLQVGGRGPDAKPIVVDTAFSAQVNPLMMNILDGVPPKGSVKLKVSTGLADAWLYDNKIYFRTKLTVLSPAWLSTVSSPDGTHVYEMMLTPYIVATQDGKTVDIKLSGL